jgi:hypothetical protein
MTPPPPPPSPLLTVALNLTQIYVTLAELTPETAQEHYVSNKLRSLVSEAVLLASLAISPEDSARLPSWVTT